MEDTIEIILMTPNKNDYNKDRARSNDLLTMANYAVTAIMFNHCNQRIGSSLHNQRQARKGLNNLKQMWDYITILAINMELEV